MIMYGCDILTTHLSLFIGELCQSGLNVEFLPLIGCLVIGMQVCCNA